MINNSDLIKRDLSYIFHPCTQMKDHETLPLVPIKRGKGVYLYDFDGNSYIDAISSWWVNLFGHSNDYINQKIKEQIEELEHVIFAGFTHEPVVKLAQRLIKITPSSLQKCFFADNGSSAVEVAIKMSFHYHKNKGLVKPFFLSLTNSYHGETLGALAVGDVGLYKETYKEIMIETLQTPSPKDTTLKSAKEALVSFEEITEKYKDKISAFIFEPLIQCAGSMKMYHPYFLKEAQNICRQKGIHLIADEIAVGFGRSGTMFACEQADVEPDFMALSKGLTGGYLPLSVVMMSDEIYSAFYCDYLENRSFLHSHSYTGNPLACAAANASLDLFEKYDILEKNRKKSEYIAKKLEIFKKLPNVKEVRQRGMIAAVELKGYDFKERVNLKIFKYALKNGVLLRPLGNIIYFMPPYIIEYEEIDKMIDTAYEAVKAL